MQNIEKLKIIGFYMFDFGVDNKTEIWPIFGLEMGIFKTRSKYANQRGGFQH